MKGRKRLLILMRVTRTPGGFATMTAPKLALTRPAALTGRVGQGGDNRVHDVALVQALLGAKRARGGRPYMSGNVTGS